MFRRTFSSYRKMNLSNRCVLLSSQTKSSLNSELPYQLLVKTFLPEGLILTLPVLFNLGFSLPAGFIPWLSVRKIPFPVLFPAMYASTRKNS